MKISPNIKVSITFYTALFASIILLTNCFHSKKAAQASKQEKAGPSSHLNLQPQISEGQIIYDIHFLQSEKENPIIALLPVVMEKNLKKDNFIDIIDGWMGLFKLRYMQIPDLNTNYSALKIFDKKMFYESLPIDTNIGFGHEPWLKIEFKDNSTSAHEK